MSFKTSFQGKKRSRHVYKMHRSAVEHEWRTAIHHSARVAEKKSFILPMIYRRLLALHTTRRENVIARVRRTFSTRIQDAAASSVSVPGRHRSLISYDVPNKPFVDIRQLYRRQIANGTSDSVKKELGFSLNDAPKETQWQLAGN